ncbi:hypothetical protein RX327_35425 [Bradyrhizobium sp. BEA-2-5]|uniref:hypothetical protein n=1 Tax=Bradyrhizobium sp. BEA-2-5 TaxID=3080015 RepID=UPI00293EBC9B|nr:hypothetical protein [Bradyrhizobium sp. BEA-2-5]WOH80971.1 hypothetical protein RX327_35425 [Bradyrhizobium sp. BEA-2-5]
MESDIRDNSAMSQFAIPLGESALAVAYSEVEEARVVLLHAELRQELYGLEYGSRLSHGVRSVAAGKSNREVPLHVLLRRPTPEYGAS